MSPRCAYCITRYQVTHNHRRQNRQLCLHCGRVVWQFALFYSCSCACELWSWYWSYSQHFALTLSTESGTI